MNCTINRVCGQLYGDKNSFAILLCNLGLNNHLTVMYILVYREVINHCLKIRLVIMFMLTTLNYIYIIQM